VPAGFKDQLAIVAELLREVARMEEGERRSTARTRSGYERELRLAGLAQRVAQAYTMIEGVVAYGARRVCDAAARTANPTPLNRAAAGFAVTPARAAPRAAAAAPARGG